MSCTIDLLCTSECPLEKGILGLHLAIVLDMDVFVGRQGADLIIWH